MSRSEGDRSIEAKYRENLIALERFDVGLRRVFRPARHRRANLIENLVGSTTLEAGGRGASAEIVGVNSSCLPLIVIW